MSQRPLFTRLLVAAFLLSTSLGCSKKEDPTTSPAAGTGSYTLDGRTVSAKATAVVTTPRTTGQSTDVLDVQLVTTPQPQSGPETLDLIFQKPTGQPNTAYQLSAINLLNGGRTQSVVYANNVTTISTTSNGGLSGTFSATATGSTIQSGVFTEVHP